jgi:hypothetical protein
LETAKQILKVIAAVAGLALVALLLIEIANPDPVLVVTNISNSQVVVSLDTDVHEVYASHPVASGSAFKTKVTGRDKLLFVVATFPSGEVIKSQGIYTTSGVQLSATVTSDAIHVSYVQG